MDGEMDKFLYFCNLNFQIALYMLKGILAVSGQPGLFKLIAEAKDRIIVESLTTGKRMPASIQAKISSLEDITVFTHSGDIPLKEIFKRIFDHENGGSAIDFRSTDDEIRKYFESVVPDYDKERVYLSDIKKVIHWYNILLEKGSLIFDEEENEESQSSETSGELSSE
jgi:hypothetical protein